MQRKCNTSSNSRCCSRRVRWHAYAHHGVLVATLLVLLLLLLFATSASPHAASAATARTTQAAQETAAAATATAAGRMTRTAVLTTMPVAAAKKATRSATTLLTGVLTSTADTPMSATQQRHQEKRLYALLDDVVRIAVYTFLSAVFAGLTLGVMCADTFTLEVIAESGPAPDCRYAAKVLPLRRQGHKTLCTLIISNMLCNVLIVQQFASFYATLHALRVAAAAAAATSGGGKKTMDAALSPSASSAHQSLYSFLVSTTIIVLFAEIIPMAVCKSRHSLRFAAAGVSVVRVAMVLTYPVSASLGALLDLIIGTQETGQIFDRNELRRLMVLHYEREGGKDNLAQTELSLLLAAMDFQERRVRDVMTPMADVTYVRATDRITQDFLERLWLSGRSRVPVEWSPGQFRDILLVKDLMSYYHSSATTTTNAAAAAAALGNSDINSDNNGTQAQQAAAAAAAAAAGGGNGDAVTVAQVVRAKRRVFAMVDEDTKLPAMLKFFEDAETHMAVVFREVHTQPQPEQQQEDEQQQQQHNDGEVTTAATRSTHASLSTSPSHAAALVLDKSEGDAAAAMGALTSTTALSSLPRTPPEQQQQQQHPLSADAPMMTTTTTTTTTVTAHASRDDVFATSSPPSLHLMATSAHNALTTAMPAAAGAAAAASVNNTTTTTTTTTTTAAAMAGAAGGGHPPAGDAALVAHKAATSTTAVVVGIVTMEDVVEELLNDEIYDEYDRYAGAHASAPRQQLHIPRNNSTLHLADLPREPAKPPRVNFYSFFTHPEANVPLSEAQVWAVVYYLTRSITCFALWPPGLLRLLLEDCGDEQLTPPPPEQQQPTAAAAAGAGAAPSLLTALPSSLASSSSPRDAEVAALTSSTRLRAPDEAAVAVADDDNDNDNNNDKRDNDNDDTTLSLSPTTALRQLRVRSPAWSLTSSSPHAARLASVSCYSQQQQQQQQLRRQHEHALRGNHDAFVQQAACASYVLYEKGTPATHFTLVLGGVVDVLVGDEGFVSRLRSFEFVGEAALTTAVYVPDFSAVVTQPARVCRISRGMYDKYLQLVLHERELQQQRVHILTPAQTTTVTAAAAAATSSERVGDSSYSVSNSHHSLGVGRLPRVCGDNNNNSSSSHSRASYMAPSRSYNNNNRSDHGDSTGVYTSAASPTGSRAGATTSLPSSRTPLQPTAHSSSPLRSGHAYGTFARGGRGGGGPYRPHHSHNNSNNNNCSTTRTTATSLR